ncbi:MAG TPA: hypothetical protein VF522_18945 [Ramlibacter sp.]|uniref:hypothetical protein n=1 Tax=Ramlibacter sp. TaxID=1917967 RepID=UPI002ED6BE5C
MSTGLLSSRAADEHRIAVAAMEAAVRARRLRNQAARARFPFQRQLLARQAAAIENGIVLVANMLMERAAQQKARA